MANKIKFYHVWDIKSFLKGLGVVLILSSFIAAYYFYPYVLRHYKLSRFDASTTGLFISSEEQIIMRQTQQGSKLQIDHFKVEFTYQVGEKSYNGMELLEGTNSNQSKLKKLLNSTDKSVVVRYMSSNPEISAIDLKK